jgi:hypothetical protein
MLDLSLENKWRKTTPISDLLKPPLIYDLVQIREVSTENLPMIIGKRVLPIISTSRK